MKVILWVENVKVEVNMEVAMRSELIKGMNEDAKSDEEDIVVPVEGFSIEIVKEGLQYIEDKLNNKRAKTETDWNAVGKVSKFVSFLMVDQNMTDKIIEELNELFDPKVNMTEFAKKFGEEEEIPHEEFVAIYKKHINLIEAPEIIAELEKSLN